MTEFEFDAALPHWINRAGFALRAEASARLAHAGVDLAAEEWALMMMLWRDGPSTVGTLAAASLRDRTTVTRLIDRLVAKGLVRREGSTADRRRVIAAPTPAGAALQQPVTAVIAALVAELRAALPPEQHDAALAALRTITCRLCGNEADG